MSFNKKSHFDVPLSPFHWTKFKKIPLGLTLLRLKKKLTSKILYKDFIKFSSVFTTKEPYITVYIWNHHKIFYQKKTQGGDQFTSWYHKLRDKLFLTGVKIRPWDAQAFSRFKKKKLEFSQLLYQSHLLLIRGK